VRRGPDETTDARERASAPRRYAVPMTTDPVRTAKKSTLTPWAAALAVVVLFLVSALGVNGNFSVPIAVAIALVLGCGTYLAMRYRR